MRVRGHGKQKIEFWYGWGILWALCLCWVLFPMDCQMRKAVWQQIWPKRTETAVVTSSITAVAGEGIPTEVSQKKAPTAAQVGPAEPIPESILQANETAAEALPAAYRIENFPLMNQMPELPTGCEITAMTTALNYEGLTADKIEMATYYLPKERLQTYWGEDGRRYGTDLDAVFAGDPTTRGGYVCGTEAICQAADHFLQDQGSSLRAVDCTGATAQELYQLVSQDHPVVVWVTIGMQDRYPAEGWYTADGDYVDWSQNDHGAVLIGYEEDTVWIADPIQGLMAYDRAQFESVYAQRGEKAVWLAEMTQTAE